MKFKLFNAFLILMGLLLGKPVFGKLPPLNDADCRRGENCDSVTVSDRDYFLKLKYLNDISSRVSFSEFRRVSRSRYEASSEKFCAIAYSCKEGKNCIKRNNRTMHDYKMHFTSPNKGSSFVLTDGNSIIPITLRLRGVVLDATDGINEDMFNNEPVVTGNNSDSYKYCRNNEFVVVAEIAADDLKTAKEGNYRGVFTATINPVEVPSEVQSLRAQDKLEIDLSLPPSLLISGLEDMELKHKENSIISETQDFCVYASGRRKFEIKAESEVGKRSFQLSKGTPADNIGYGVTVGKANSGTGHSKELIEGKFNSHPSWKGAKELFCGGEDNMEITLTIKESEVIDKPPGTYKDTLYLTVKPAS